MKKDIFEELVVVKRSGQRVNFNSYKIALAIKNAFDSVISENNEKRINKVYESVLEYIENIYQGRKTINVEDIQDIIENKLKVLHEQDVYLAFSDYRQKRALSRKSFLIKQQHKFAKSLEKISDNNYLLQDSEYTPKELIDIYGSMVTTGLIKSYVIDNKYLRMHEEGNFFIHNLEDYPLGRFDSVHIDFDKVINDIDNLCSFTNYVINLKNEVSNEINIPRIDYLFEKYYVNKFKVYYKEFLNNYIKLSGFNKLINMDKLNNLINKESSIIFNDDDYEQFMPSDNLKLIFKNAYMDALDKLKCKINKELTKMFITLNNEKYNYSISFGTNDSYIGNIINKEIISLLDGIDRLDYLSAIFKVDSVKNVFLNDISNLIILRKNILISINKEENLEYLSNGVRIYESYTEANNSNGKILNSCISINMPRLAMSSSSKNEFYEKLDSLLELCKNELLFAFELLGNRGKENYHYLFNNNIMNDEKMDVGGKIRKVIKSGSLLIGLVGLKECALTFNTDENKSYQSICEIIKYVNKKCSEYSAETKLNFYTFEPSSSKVREYFICLDKTVYGFKKNITDKNKYDLVSSLHNIKNDYGKLSNINKLLIGSNLFELNVSKNTNSIKLTETIKELFNNNVGIIKFRIKE